MEDFAEMHKEVAVLEARLEEARSFPDKLVKKFASVLAERDLIYEEKRDKSETALTNLLEKLAPAQHEKSADTTSVPREKVREEVCEESREETNGETGSGRSRHPDTEIEEEIQQTTPPTFADVASSKRSRSKTVRQKPIDKSSAPQTVQEKRSKKEKARSISRIKKGKEKLDKIRGTSPSLAFFMTPSPGVSVEQTKKDLWTEIIKRTKTPKIVAITAKSGKVVLKPQDRETADILRCIAKNGSNQMVEESPLLPRIIIEGIKVSMLPDEIPSAVASQNPHLNIEPGQELDMQAYL